MATTGKWHGCHFKKFRIEVGFSMYCVNRNHEHILILLNIILKPSLRKHLAALGRIRLSHVMQSCTFQIRIKMEVYFWTRAEFWSAVSKILVRSFKVRKSWKYFCKYYTTWCIFWMALQVWCGSHGPIFKLHHLNNQNF